MIAVRKGITFRSPLCMAGWSRMQSFAAGRACSWESGRKRNNDDKDDIFRYHASQSHATAGVSAAFLGRWLLGLPPRLGPSGANASATPSPPSTPGSASDLVDDLP